MREARFSLELVREIKDRYPGCIVLKNDPELMQGFPDLTVLHNDHWACLEVKAEKASPHQPNQDYYIQKANDMSFGSFIYPENKTEILNELDQHFKD